LLSANDVAEPDLACAGELRVRFASLSTVSFADAFLPTLETAGGGEVEVLSGLEEEEVSDELLIAHGETELATEFLAGTPTSPLPVREAAV
jgi:hypothetical protein